MLHVHIYHTSMLYIHTVVLLGTELLHVNMYDILLYFFPQYLNL